MEFNKINHLAFENFLLARYERLKGITKVNSLPYILAMDPSSICQLGCPSCPTGVENFAKWEGHPLHFRSRVVMSKEMFDAIIEELGDYLFYILFYNWGEPLFNDNLPYFIERAKTYHIYTEIHTNLAMKLTDEKIENLLLSGVDEIGVSIDGFSQQSYSVYRRGGDFERAKENITRLVRTRDRLGLKNKIIWNFLVFSFNEKEISLARKYCKANNIVFNQRVALIDEKEHPEWFPSTKYRGASPNRIQRYLRKKGYSLQAKISKITGRTITPTPDIWLPDTCCWHYAISVINADGSISPCCVPWEQKFDLGSIIPGEVSFTNVWNNELYQKSRNAFSGEVPEALSGISTLCMSCKYPREVRFLYSNHDNDVIRCYNKAIGIKDASLYKACKLYGNRSKFVQYYEDHLIRENNKI